MVVAVRYFVVYPFLLQLLKYSGLQFDMPQTVQPATPISSEEHPPMQVYSGAEEDEEGTDAEDEGGGMADEAEVGPG